MERYEQYQTRQPDITGIYQGFRCVGSQSKLGADFPVKAYKMSDNRYTLEDIKDSIPNCKVDLSVLTEKPKKRKRVSCHWTKQRSCTQSGIKSGL